MVYADDSQLRDVSFGYAHGGMKSLSYIGPAYGYFVNPMKTWLVVKEGFRLEDEKMFENMGIRITTAGRSNGLYNRRRILQRSLPPDFDIDIDIIDVSAPYHKGTS